MELLPGIVHGVVLTYTSHPMDTVKTRLQTGMYSSTRDCMRNTFKQEGIRGLYRGASMPLLGNLSKAYQFTMFERLKGNGVNPFLSGTISSVCGSMTGNPMQVIKVNMQATTEKSYSGIVPFVKTHYRKHGFMGFYRGLGANVMKDATFGGMFFGCYGVIRDKLPNTPLYNIVSASSSSFLCWTMLMPIDYLKTQLQNNGHNETATQIIRNSIRNRGIRSLWTGYVPAVIRMVPISAITMGIYEYVRRII